MPCFKCFIHVKNQFREFTLYYLSSGRLREVKNKQKCQTVKDKSVTVAYARWPLTRGSKYSDLTGKLNWSLRRGGGDRRFDCNDNDWQ